MPARATAPAGMPPRTGAWVVVPTYNERATLPALVARLLNALPAAPAADLRILVVDDNSPDGTGALADELAAADERLAVLHRTAKTGLGDAYAAGFAVALDAGARRIIQMDADGSHDPAAIPALLAALDAGADLAVGSRYVAGGATPDWPLRRRILSRGGCAYARLVLGLEIRDLTGGFKAWRPDTLEAALAEPLTVQGYGFQIELTERAVRGGARVTEVPIAFRDRTQGESKMGAAIVREAIVRVPQLRLAARTAGTRTADGGRGTNAPALSPSPVNRSAGAR
ncbi:glycosyltransferase [Baekduia sp.]|uniref:glycosyltransferase n=1 Tax=Baekduia sp. TaxID=2600305 RepID=UPI002D1FAC5F|nr:glycosyltransferase [Baekduia sp.]